MPVSNAEKRGALRRFAAAVVVPPASLLTRRVWLGKEHIPSTGGVVIACNHISEVDFVVMAHYVYGAGRFPCFLAKDGVFKAPLVGSLLRSLGQIPVYRNSRRSADALRAAIDAVRDGACVVVYPEGTITGDPDLWPMRGKSGAVRIALEAGVPLVPVANWGAQAILPYHGRPRPLPPKRVRVLAGEPVDLAAYRDSSGDPAATAEAMDAVMRRIAELVGELRGEHPPAELYDSGRRESGR